MPVFSLCLKIIKKNIPMMMIYFGIFIMVSFIMVQMSSSEQQAGFSESKVSMAFIAEEQTPLVEGLRDTLSDIAFFVDVKPDIDSLQDALYFREVKYILRIPAGFTESFIRGEEPVLEKTVVPDTMDNVYVDMGIDQYLNIARLYLSRNPDMDPDLLRTYVTEDLSKTVNVQTRTDTSPVRIENNLRYHFNYIPYTLMFVVILGTASIMLILNNPDIKRRNACSPIESGKITLQFFLANTILTLGSWLILVAFSLCFGYRHIAEPSTGYYILNSFVFALSAAGISYFIGSLVKGRETIIALANVVTLGSSFISGVFVPQELLGESVLKIASFLPPYWYVKANNKIAEISVFSRANMTEVANALLIQLGFAIAFFILALVIGKRKQLSLEEA